jgi:hypothetical protein
MLYRSYLKHLCHYVLSSSIVLGMIIGITILVSGKGSMNLDMDFDFGALDGLTVLIGLPLVAVLLFSLLSPLSFWIHQLLSKKPSGS